MEGTSLRLLGLVPGTYVWRVSSLDDQGREGEFGFARRFMVYAPRAAAPAPMEEAQVTALPADFGIFKVASLPTSVELSWTGGRQPYRVVVARRPGLDKAVLVEKTLADSSVTIPILKQGVYYWGVFTLSTGGKQRALLSATRRFIISKRTPPELHLPSINWGKK